MTRTRWCRRRRGWSSALTSCLKAYFPVALTLFTKLQQPATLVFLQRYPTLEIAEAASVEELTAFLRTLPRFPGPRVAAQRIFIRLHQPHLRADPVTTRVKARVKARLTQALVAQLLSVVEQIDDHAPMPPMPRRSNACFPTALTPPSS